MAAVVPRRRQLDPTAGLALPGSDVWDPNAGLYYRDDGRGDRGIMQEVARYGRVWAIREGDAVLDLGGHIGAAAIWALRHGAAQVLSVEPNAENYRMLALNAYGRPIVPVFGAVAAVSGPLTLYESARFHYGHSTATRGKKQPRLVPGWSLEELLERSQATFVKCDIEGAEYDLPGLRDLPLRVRGLAMEVHFSRGRAVGIELLEAIEKQGFVPVRPYGISPKAWHVNASWQRP